MARARRGEKGELQTERTTVVRKLDRGRNDFATVAAILDEGFVCHVGFVADGQPYVIPTGYGRRDRTVYLHGLAVNRMLNHLERGVPLCLTVTLIDGIVYARSGFHHSMNYRSVMLLGTAFPVEGAEKVDALRVIMDHITPGRWDDAREPTPTELKGTAVLALAIEEASAKVRSGDPVDDEEDYALPCWAGVLPFALTAGAPIPDARLTPGIAVPEYVSKYRRGARPG